MTRLARVALLLWLPACVGNVQRSARVPHAAVPLFSGQPLAQPFAATAGLSNVADVVAPAVGDPTQAVEVPTTQARGELRLRLGERAEIAAIHERGFAATSKQPDPTQAPVGPGDVAGYGLALGYSIATDIAGLSVGARVEGMVWSVPFVEYLACTNCTTPTTITSHGHAQPATLGLGVTPSYHTGNLTVFGGLFARNHPTTQRKEANTTLSSDGDVQDGPFNLLLHAGVEVQLTPWLSALALIHQDVVTTPVRYGPGLGLALTAQLGK